MNKYYIPEINIHRFSTEIATSASGDPDRDYIEEVGALAAVLGKSEAAQKKMVTIGKIIQFNQ